MDLRKTPPGRIQVPEIGQPMLPQPIIVEYRDEGTKELQGRVAYPQVFVTFVSDDVLAKIAAHVAKTTTSVIFDELARRGIIPPEPPAVKEVAPPPESEVQSQGETVPYPEEA